MAYDDLRAAFQEGDVVFGLNGPLFKAVESLQRPRSIGVRKFRFFGNKETKSKGIVQADLTDVVWNPRNPTEYATDREISKSLATKRLGTGFRAHLAGHPKYDVASQYREGKLRRGPGQQSPKDLTNAWGRTSKAGLEYHLNRGATIHFVVTDIDLDKVTKKSEQHKHLVTSRELRYLYRRRNEKAVKERVKFYDESGQIDQQAFFGRPEWKQYTPKKDVVEHESSTAKGSGEKDYWNRQVAESSLSQLGTKALSLTPSKSIRPR